jgi:hypothetical protein
MIFENTKFRALRCTCGLCYNNTDEGGDKESKHRDEIEAQSCFQFLLELRL